MLFFVQGGELQSQITNILERILTQLYKIQCSRTKASTLRAVLSLATHHSKGVCGILLNQPLPFDK